MSLIRVLRTASAAITHTFYVDETPTDATGTPTVSVRRLDGTVVSSGNATKPLATTGIYQYTVPGQATVDTLTVDWTANVAGATVVARDIVEVVGGFLFGLAEARAQPPPLATDKYPTTTLAAKRTVVEQECETICGQAFVPRFARVALSGNDQLGIRLPDINIRTIRAVSVSGTALDSTELTHIATSAGVMYHTNRIWPVGNANLIVEYEHGWDYPPEEIREACMLRLRSRLNMTDTGIPHRALSFTVAEGGTYRLSVPSGARTGVPDVDAVYERYAVQVGGFA